MATTKEQILSRIQQAMSLQPDHVRNEQLGQILGEMLALSSAGASPWVKDVNGIHALTDKIGIGIAVPTKELHVVGGFKETFEDTGSDALMESGTDILLDEIGGGGAPFLGFKQSITDKNNGDFILHYLADLAAGTTDSLWGVTTTSGDKTKTISIDIDKIELKYNEVIGSINAQIALNQERIDFQFTNGAETMQLFLNEKVLHLEYNGAPAFSIDYTTPGNPAFLLKLPTHADNTAASGSGLAVDNLYKTATGEVRIVV